MRRIDRWNLAADVAANWELAHKGWDGRWGSEKSQLVHERLVALGPNPRPDDVDRITGTTSWSNVGFCSECGGAAPELVEFGTLPDPDYGYARVCTSCLLKALQLLEE